MSEPRPLADYIRSIPDFPKPGILFRDITPLLASPAALRETIRQFADHFRDAGVSAIAAAEAR
ncbi:MAG: adenine phosphoribosyltransferase, partial [Planctomycetaceae bacterium]|nr:adenine phosphoribosyltransferase [Planctomycetaceae bacterium]